MPGRARRYAKPCWAVLAALAGLAAAPCRAQVRAFDIPAEAATDSLPAFAAQADVQLVAPSSKLAGVRTPAVKGRFGTDAALRRLLRGTGLEVASADGRQIVLRMAPPSSPPLARTAPPSAPPRPPGDAAPTRVVVVGYRRDYEDAARMKRNGAGISDSLSADGLGRFPDLNVGEALQRIAGVQINREAASRDATVNLRGLPSTFARVIVNGEDVAMPFLDSSTPMGAFNSDMFTAITIDKSPGADLPSGGLSGVIDLKIMPAVSRARGGWVKFGYEYDDLGGYLSPNLAFSLADHTRDNALAGFLSVAWKRETFRRDSIYFTQYSPLDAASADPVSFPSEIRQISRYNQGTLVSVAGGFDAQRSETTSLRVQGFFSRRNAPDTHTQLLDVDLRSPLTTITPQGDVYSLPDGARFISRYAFSNASVYASYRDEPFLEQTSGLSARLVWRSDPWRVTAALNQSSAADAMYQTQLDARSLAKADGGGDWGQVDSGAGDIGAYRFTLGPAPAVALAAGTLYSYPGTGPYIAGSDGDQFVVAGVDGRTANRLVTARVDAERRLDAHGLSGIKAGWRYESSVLTSAEVNISPIGANLSAIAPDFVVPADLAADFFGGTVPGYNRNWPTIDYARALSAMLPAAGDGLVLGHSGFANDPLQPNYLSSNFRREDRTLSGYALADLDARLLGLPLHGQAGLRYEQTTSRTATFDTSLGADGVSLVRTPVLYRGVDIEWLPSVLLNADLTPDLKLRADGYRTFVRPQPRQFVPATVVTLSSGAAAVNIGSPNLRPYRADNLDLALEWYPGAGRVAALTLFAKRITDFVRAVVSCPSDPGYGLGPLQIVGSDCVALRDGALVTYTRTLNDPAPLDLTGLELSVQGAFNELPAPWNRLGGAFNYSYTQVRGRSAAERAALLTGTSRNQLNLILYYETPRWGVRAVYDYRDGYSLASVGTFSGGASQVRPRGQIDLSSTLSLTPRLSLSLDAFNVTDAIRQEYQGAISVPRRFDYDGRTYAISLRAAF
jgi:TonB-dependent receptor